LLGLAAGLLAGVSAAEAGEELAYAVGGGRDAGKAGALLAVMAAAALAAWFGWRRRARRPARWRATALRSAAVLAPAGLFIQDEPYWTLGVAVACAAAWAAQGRRLASRATGVAASLAAWFLAPAWLQAGCLASGVAFALAGVAPARAQAWAGLAATGAWAGVLLWWAFRLGGGTLGALVAATSALVGLGLFAVAGLRVRARLSQRSPNPSSSPRR
jgi:hypothetical protein